MNLASFAKMSGRKLLSAKETNTHIFSNFINTTKGKSGWSILRAPLRSQSMLDYYLFPKMTHLNLPTYQPPKLKISRVRIDHRSSRNTPPVKKGFGKRAQKAKAKSTKPKK
eukprot:TRINITY_DN1377_c2_g3_i1.p1 TRINITY_DN1377_c2_g3~~TRINITY_DN1377_c2_g3_i1.p1  ORF type:complete len:111 (-),score=48.13 TRINITY_DN1377_c2_g3_i1:77-409(-)